jgi:molybdate transport system substrate-binding protein
MRTCSTIAAAAMLAWLNFASTAPARADEVALMTTGAVEQIMKGLIPAFERASGHTVSMSVLGTGPAVAKIREGTFADLILLGPDALNELAGAGKVDAGSIAPVFRSASGSRSRPAPRSRTSAPTRRSKLRCWRRNRSATASARAASISPTSSS